LPRVAGEAFSSSPLSMVEGFTDSVMSGGETGVEDFVSQADQADLASRARDPLDTAPWQRSSP
jgi:hypothetical protein